MGFIRTLLGDIEPEKLGVTYSHEHIKCEPPYWKEKGEDDLLLDDFKKSLKEVEDFKKAGGNSIIDATVIDYGRDSNSVAKISQETGVHIVGTTGFNKSFLWGAKIPNKNITFAQWIEDSSVNELSEYLSLIHI